MEIPKKTDEKNYIITTLTDQIYAIPLTDTMHLEEYCQENTINAPNGQFYPSSNYQLKNGLQKTQSMGQLWQMRELIGIITFEEEIKSEIQTIKNTYLQWLDALKKSLNEEKEFKLSADFHHCETGAKITEYLQKHLNNEVKKIIDQINQIYQQILHSAKKLLEIAKTNPELAKQLLQQESELFNSLPKVLKNITTELIRHERQILIVTKVIEQMVCVIVDDVTSVIDLDKKNTIKKSEDNKNYLTDGERLIPIIRLEELINDH